MISRVLQAKIPSHSGVGHTGATKELKGPEIVETLCPYEPVHLTQPSLFPSLLFLTGTAKATEMLTCLDAWPGTVSGWWRFRENGKKRPMPWPLPEASISAHNSRELCCVVTDSRGVQA